VSSAGFFDSGFIGETDWDEARGDMIADYTDDMRAHVGKVVYEQNEERKVLYI
jgi:hypothetical protein